MSPIEPSAAELQKLLKEFDHASILRAINIICGAAVDDGKLVHMKGGCGKEVNAHDAYRCVDCAASFHRNCMREHLKDETEKDNHIRLLESQKRKMWATIKGSVHGTQAHDLASIHRQAEETLASLSPPPL